MTLEFDSCRADTGGEIGAAGPGQAPQHVDHFFTIGRHRLGQITLAVEADDADLDIAFR